MASFDVVSKINMAEVDNALNQTRKELDTRYDFKGTQTTLEKTDEGIVLKANSDGRVRAALEVLQGKLVKRAVPLKNARPGEVQPAGGGLSRLVVKLVQGIEMESAKRMAQSVKDTKLKVQASIQGDTVRVTGKIRDDLQSVMQMLRGADWGVEVQFTNFRD